MGGYVFHRMNQFLKPWLESAHVAHYVQAHALSLEFVDFLFQRLDEQAHQKRDLFLGPAPVFRTKGKKRQVAHAQLAADLYDEAHRLHSPRMARAAGQKALRGPPALAIPDYRTLLRYGRRIGNRSCGAGLHSSEESTSALQTLIGRSTDVL